MQKISETHEKEEKDLCRSLVFSPAKPSRSLQNIFLKMYTKLINHNDVWEDLAKCKSTCAPYLYTRKLRKIEEYLSKCKSTCAPYLYTRKLNKIEENLSKM